MLDRRVMVNGTLVQELPVLVNPQEDRIEVDGKPLARRKTRQARKYLMVFKPRNVISTNRDPQGRKRVIDLVPHSQHLFCVGRLDADSTGLILLSDDGELCQRLTHPRYEIAKRYHVIVKGRVEPGVLDTLRRGVFLARPDGKGAVKARVKIVKLLRNASDRSELLITLTEGRNREIRRLLARVGHPVKRLRRVGLGPVSLKGLAPGQWRALNRAEVTALRKAVGLLPHKRPSQTKPDQG